MRSDPALAGAVLWTALAVVAGGIAHRSPATIGTWAAVGWGFYLLTANPYAGATVLLAVALWIIHRWGLRHLLLYGGGAFVFATITWVNIISGMLLPAALGNAAARMVWFTAFTYGAFILWRLATQRLGYLTNPLAWAAETRRVQGLQEHKRAMGLGRRGVGWAGRRTRQAITGRTPPALPRPPDKLDQLDRDDLSRLARRHGVDPDPWLTDELRDQVREAEARPPEPATAHTRDEAPAQAVDVGHLSPAPLFHHRESVWRIRP